MGWSGSGAVTGAKPSKLLYLGIAAALVGFLIWATGVLKPKGPAASPQPVRLPKTSVTYGAFTSYQKAQFALGQQQGSQPLRSVDQVIARRRLQEQFCFQFARCILPEGPPEARALTLPTGS